MESFAKFKNSLLVGCITVLLGLVAYIGNGIINRLDKIQSTVNEMQGDNKAILIRLANVEDEVKKNRQDIDDLKAAAYYHASQKKDLWSRRTNIG